MTRLWTSLEFRIWALLVCVSVAVWSTFYPIQALDDSRAYIALAELPLSSSLFWAHFDKPFLTSLVLKLLGGNVVALVVTQTLVHMLAACCVLAAIHAVAMRRLSRAVLSGFVLTLTLSSNFLPWTQAVFTESLSHSLLLLWLASSVALAQVKADRVRVVLILHLVVAGLLVFARDSNQYLVAGWALLLLLTAALRGRRDRWLVVAVASLALAIGAQQLSHYRQRWSGALNRSYEDRVVRVVANAQDQDLNAARRQWFEAHGMPPATPVETQRFQTWMRVDGLKTYQRYLLSHWRQGIAEVFEPSIAFRLHSPDTTTYAFGWPAPLRRVIDRVASYDLSRLWFQALLLICALSIVLNALRRHDYSALLAAYWVLATPVMMFLIWHACSIEVERHAIFIKLISRLGGAWVLVACADRLWDRFAPGHWRASTRPPHPLHEA